jgi:hypothetical protein
LSGVSCATLGRVDEADWRIREELARAEEYRRVLESSVEFEKSIRNRWRDKNREKNRRIAELEERVAELERQLRERS